VLPNENRIKTLRLTKYLHLRVAVCKLCLCPEVPVLLLCRPLECLLVAEPAVAGCPVSCDGHRGPSHAVFTSSKKPDSRHLKTHTLTTRQDSKGETTQASSNATKGQYKGVPDAKGKIHVSCASATALFTDLCDIILQLVDSSAACNTPRIFNLSLNRHVAPPLCLDRNSPWKRLGDSVSISSEFSLEQKEARIWTMLFLSRICFRYLKC
jgi:hypothetical protein